MVGGGTMATRPNANYWPAEPLTGYAYTAKPASICGTDNLIAELEWLDELIETTDCDYDAATLRIFEIKKELKRRGR